MTGTLNAMAGSIQPGKYFKLALNSLFLLFFEGWPTPVGEGETKKPLFRAASFWGGMMPGLNTTPAHDSSTVSDPASSGLNALIEHLYADECSSPQKIIAIASDYSEEITRIFALPCGSWSCPECGERKKKEWQFDIMYGVSKYMQEKRYTFIFLTLTLSGRAISRNNSISEWRLLWPRINSRHWRVHGWCPYVLIPELHKNAVVHLHALFSSTSSERWWKDNSYLSGAGYQVKRRLLVDGDGAGAYGAKYLGKQQHIKQWPKHYRRVRTSHHWPKMPRPDPNNAYEWKVIHPDQLQWTITYHYGIGMNIKWGWSNLTVDA